MEFASMAEAAEHQRMTAVAHTHEVQSFFMKLDKEDLDTLKMLLLSFADPQAGPYMAAQHHGMITQIQVLKYGNCICGLDHEQPEDLLKDVGNPHPDGTGEEYSEPGELINRATANLKTVMDGGVPKGPSGAELMEMYNMQLRPGDNALVCRGCGLWYASLMDRMMKSPDDCHGCHLKSAQG